MDKDKRRGFEPEKIEIETSEEGEGGAKNTRRSVSAPKTLLRYSPASLPLSLPWGWYSVLFP